MIPGGTSNFVGCSSSASSPAFGGHQSNSMRIDLSPNSRGDKALDTSTGASPATKSVRTNDSAADSSALCKDAKLTVAELLDKAIKCGATPRTAGAASSTLLVKDIHQSESAVADSPNRLKSAGKEKQKQKRSVPLYDRLDCIRRPVSDTTNEMGAVDNAAGKGRRQSENVISSISTSARRISSAPGQRHTREGGEKSPLPVTMLMSDETPVSFSSPVCAPVYAAAVSRPKSAPSSKCRKVSKGKVVVTEKGWDKDEGRDRQMHTNTVRDTIGDLKDCSEAGRMCLSARDAYIDRSPVAVRGAGAGAMAAPSSSSGEGGRRCSNFNPSRGAISLQVDVEMDTDDCIGIDADGEERQDRYANALGLDHIPDNDDSESVSQKIDQLILEAQLVQEKKSAMVRGEGHASSQKERVRGRRGEEKGSEREKGINDVRSSKGPLRRAGSSRCPASYSDVDGTYGESLCVPYTSSATSSGSGDVAWSDSLATSRPSDVFSIITLSSQKQSGNGTYTGSGMGIGIGTGLGSGGSWSGQRRVSFGGEGTGAGRHKMMSGIALREDLESRARDTLVSKLLLNREVEEGSSKQLRGLGNFQAQLMRSSSGMKNTRKRLEDAIELQRALQRDKHNGIAPKSLRAMSAMGPHRGAGATRPRSPRRHSVSSGVDVLEMLEQRAILGETQVALALPDMSVYQNAFESEGAVSHPYLPSSMSVCGSLPAYKGPPSPFSPTRRAESAPAYTLPNMMHTSSSANRSSNSSSRRDRGSRTFTPSPKLDAPFLSPTADYYKKGVTNGQDNLGVKRGDIGSVSKKFRLIRELADMAKKTSNDHCDGMEGPKSASRDRDRKRDRQGAGSGPGTPSGLNLTEGSRGPMGFFDSGGSKPCSPKRSPSRMSPSSLQEQDKEAGVYADHSKLDVSFDGMPIRTMTARSLEDRKKRQFWTKVVFIASIRNMMSSRVKEQLEVEKMAEHSKCVAAANMIGECFMRYFRRRMDGLVDVMRREHPNARRPFRLLVRMWRRRQAVLPITAFINACAKCTNQGVLAFYIIRYMRACKRIQRNIRSFLQCKRARVLCVLRIWEDMEMHLIKRMLKKVARERVDRKSLDGSITESMMVWQQRRSLQDNSDAMKAFTKAKGRDKGAAGLLAKSAAGQVRTLTRLAKIDSDRIEKWSQLESKVEQFMDFKRIDGRLSEADTIKKYLLPNSIRIPLIKSIIEIARKESIANQAEAAWQLTKNEKKYTEFSEADVSLFLRSDESTMLKTLQKKLKVGKKAALSSHYDFMIPKVKKKVLFIFYSHLKFDSILATMKEAHERRHSFDLAVKSKKYTAKSR